MIKAYNKTREIKIPDGYIFDQLITPSHMIKTMTVCLRRDLLNKHYLEDKGIMSQDWKMIDISIWLQLARWSKFHYFNEVFATYRLLPESMSRSNDPVRLHAFHCKIHNIKLYFAERYDVNENMKKTLLINKYKSNIADAFLMGDKTLANNRMRMLKNMNVKPNFKEKIMVNRSYKHPFSTDDNVSRRR